MNHRYWKPGTKLRTRDGNLATLLAPTWNSFAWVLFDGQDWPVSEVVESFVLNAPLTRDAADEWDQEVFELDAIKTLCSAYDIEHDYDSDEDPTATRELIFELRALHEKLINKLGPRPPAPEPAPANPDIPF